MAITLDGDNLTTVGVINSKTAVASTSGTSIDFTGIPSGVKRITVMFNGVSTNGTSNIQIQIGAGSITSSGYTGAVSIITSAATNTASFSAGFLLTQQNAATYVYSGLMVITNIGSNIWAASSQVGNPTTTVLTQQGGGNVTLSGTLDRVRITTVNGTDTFDAGSINILYE